MAQTEPVPPAVQIAQLEEAVAAVAAKLTNRPRIGLVLGSGLGDYAAQLQEAVQIPYASIPHMPTPGVAGHAGELWVGLPPGASTAARPVACLRGRVHGYEGHRPADVVFAVRMLRRLGCDVVLLTNAAGGVRPSFVPGALMLLSDHLNLMGTNPLIGPNLSELGTRFPDMTQAYDKELAGFARDAAREVGVRLEEGVYAGLSGPTYETPAEVRMLRLLGADAVGMSTVPEAIALRHAGARVGAISCITNLGAGMSPGILSHDEVAETAGQAKEGFQRLLSAWLARIDASLA
ncbi:MAG: purine-nucleoside phosphorylase [Myxococcota bacterium]